MRINLDRCQRWLYNRAECVLCAEICPVGGCIQSKGRKVFINKERCIGCGICTNVCPSNSFFIKGLSDRQLYTAFKPNREDEALVFCCTLGPLAADRNRLSHQASQIDLEKPELSTRIELPCLGLVKESHLVAINLSGVNGIYLDISRCRDCFIRHGKRTIERTVTHAQNFLTAIGCSDRITLLSTPFGSKPAENFKAKRLKTKTIETSANYSRREFFSLLTGKATERIVEHNSQDGIPEKRAILIEALKILAEREDLSSRHIKDGAFPIHQVEAGERCTLCHSCELFCPTGALKRIEEDGELRIDFQISLCVRCYQCEELCPQGALYYRDSIDLMPLLNNKIRTLRKLSQKDCPQCGRPYFSKKVLDECPRCRKKKDLDSRIIAILTGDSDGESLRIRRKGKGVKSVGSVT